MRQLDREKWDSLRRTFGHKLQFKTRHLPDGRLAIVVAHYFRRPRDIHRNPPELSDELRAYVADMLGAKEVTVEHGFDTDEVWGLVIEKLPALILVPSE